MAPQDDWLPAVEAARQLGVSRPRIHQLVRANVLDGWRVAGRLFIHRRSLDIWARHGADNPSLSELRSKRGPILRLAARHGARNVRVFGSVARGEARRDSDVDFVVDLDAGHSVLDLAELIVDLEDELGRSVDVVELRTPSAVADRIRREAVAL